MSPPVSRADEMAVVSHYQYPLSRAGHLWSRAGSRSRRCGYASDIQRTVDVITKTLFRAAALFMFAGS